MSKAEKFIQENTKNCSNEYLTDSKPDGLGGYISRRNFSPWLTPDQVKRAVEIAREEIFEKMKFYIESMVSDITFSDIDGNDNYDLNKFTEDLKQAIKNE